MRSGGVCQNSGAQISLRSLAWTIKARALSRPKGTTTSSRSVVSRRARYAGLSSTILDLLFRPHGKRPDQHRMSPVGGTWIGSPKPLQGILVETSFEDAPRASCGLQDYARGHALRSPAVTVRLVPYPDLAIRAGSSGLSFSIPRASGRATCEELPLEQHRTLA